MPDRSLRSPAHLSSAEYMPAEAQDTQTFVLPREALVDTVCPQGPHLGQMISQFVPGILGLLQPIYECCVYHVTLSAQVIGRLGQDAVHHGLQRHRVVPLLVRLLHVGIREVQPVIQTH